MRRDVRARALGPVRGAGSIGPSGDESGSGTILVVALLATATACALVLAIGGSILAARARLAAVADLAALAGADVSATSAWEEVGSRPCEEARAVAEANGVELESCEIIGADTRVVVVSKGAGLASPILVRSRARAGPASTSEIVPGGDSSGAP